MPHQKWWSRWRVNSNLARTSFQINLYRTQLQGDENLKTRLPSENSYRCDREVCYNVLQLPDVLHELPIRCNIRISGIFVLSERRRRKFYGTQRPQSAPSSFISPWSNHQTEYILGMTNLTDFLIKWNPLNSWSIFTLFRINFSSFCRKKVPWKFKSKNSIFLTRFRQNQSRTF